MPSPTSCLSFTALFPLSEASVYGQYWVKLSTAEFSGSPAMSHDLAYVGKHNLPDGLELRSYDPTTEAALLKFSYVPVANEGAFLLPDIVAVINPDFALQRLQGSGRSMVVFSSIRPPNLHKNAPYRGGVLFRVVLENQSDSAKSLEAILKLAKAPLLQVSVDSYVAQPCNSA